MIASRPMRTMVAAMVLGLVGCGGSGPGDPFIPQPTQTPPPALSIIGDWAVTINTSCLELLQFTAPNAYAVSVGCVALDGTLEDEVEGGTFALSGSRLTFAPTRSTCPAAVMSGTANVTLTASTLAIPFSDGTVVVFARVTVPNSSGVIQLGCFNSGQFTPGPIMNL